MDLTGYVFSPKWHEQFFMMPKYWTGLLYHAYIHHIMISLPPCILVVGMRSWIICPGCPIVLKIRSGCILNLHLLFHKESSVTKSQKLGYAGRLEINLRWDTTSGYNAWRGRGRGRGSWWVMKQLASASIFGWDTTSKEFFKLLSPLTVYCSAF